MGFHNSKKVIIDGYKFDSKIEGDYYLYLRDSKHIDRFDIQPKFLIMGKFEKHGEKFRDMYYIADFYVIEKSGDSYAVDIKGMPTNESKIKRKLFFKNYDIPMKRLQRYKGEWVDYFENQKRISQNKKKSSI